MVAQKEPITVITSDSTRGDAANEFTLIHPVSINERGARLGERCMQSRLPKFDLALIEPRELKHSAMLWYALNYGCAILGERVQ